MDAKRTMRLHKSDIFPVFVYLPKSAFGRLCKKPAHPPAFLLFWYSPGVTPKYFLN